MDTGLILRELLQILLKNPVISGKNIQDKLEEKGYKLNIKTVYRYIDHLNDFFDPYLLIKSIRKKGYTIETTFFSNEQLQILLDSLQSNKELSPEDQVELKERLEMVSPIQQLEVITEPEIPDEEANYSLLKNLEVVRRAIREKKGLRFKYISYIIEDDKPKEDPRRENGTDKMYHISPYVYKYTNNHYYVLGYDTQSKEEKLRTYRLDRMRTVQTDRKYQDISDQFDLNNKSIFSSDEKDYVKELRIEFKEVLIREVVSHYPDITLKKARKKSWDEYSWYEGIITDINFDMGEKNWILQLGAGIKVTYPESKKNEMREEIEEMLKHYS